VIKEIHVYIQEGVGGIVGKDGVLGGGSVWVVWAVWVVERMRHLGKGLGEHKGAEQVSELQCICDWGRSRDTDQGKQRWLLEN